MTVCDKNKEPIGIHCKECDKTSYSKGDIDHEFCVVCGFHDFLVGDTFDLVYEYPDGVPATPVDVAHFVQHIKGVFCWHLLIPQKEPRNGYRWAVCNKCDRVAYGKYSTKKKKLVWRMLKRYAQGGVYSANTDRILRDI